MLREPDLFIGAEFLEDYHQDDSEVTAKAFHNYMIDGAAPLAKLRLRLNDMSEFDAWKAIEMKRPGHLIIEVGNIENNLETAFRLARDQRRKGGSYVMCVDPRRRDQVKRHPACLYAMEHHDAKYDSVSGADAIRGCKRTAPDTSDKASSYPVEIESPENAENQEPQGEDEMQVHEPTAREKEAIEKLHRNLGHPSNKELSRVLSLSRASPHLVRWAAQGHHCPNCAAHGAPKAVRPSMIPRSYAPNSVVGVDLFQLPNFDGSDQFWMLNMVMVCHGTSFQSCERVKSKEPQEVWAAFSRSWGRLLGWPQVLIADQGTEFLGDFKGKCSDLGIILHTLGARAPHQQGRTERHGALFKATFQKAVWDCPPQDHHEWRLLLRETEAAKNKSFNRSGFSPIQRMMGHSPRANGEVMFSLSGAWAGNGAPADC